MLATATYNRPWLAPYQLEALFCAERYAVVEATTKAGKTAGCMVWLTERAMAGRPGQNFWWVAPIRDQAKIVYRRLKRSLPIELYTSNEQDLTLTLLNGRRMANEPMQDQYVSVNVIPRMALDRAETLRDGASSIYGTDAVAGVVNYITRPGYNGTELALRYGITELGDGQEMRATLTHGLTFAGGKGNLMIVADLYDRDPMYARDRHFSAEADNSYRAPAPWNVSTNTTFNLRSATTEFGNFSTGTVTNGVFTAARPAGVPSTLVASSGTFFIVPTAG